MRPSPWRSGFVLTERVDDLCGLSEQLSPCGLGRFEPVLGAKTLQRPCRIGQTLSGEIRGRAPQGMRRRAYLFGVGAVDRSFDGGEPHRTVVEKQANHVEEQLFIASKPLHQAIVIDRSGRRRGRRSGCIRRSRLTRSRARRSARRGLMLQGRVEEGRTDRFGQVPVHAGVQAALTIPVHRVRSHGDDAQVTAVGCLSLPDGGSGVEPAHFGHL